MHLANSNFWQNMEKAPPTLPYMHFGKIGCLAKKSQLAQI